MLNRTQPPPFAVPGLLQLPVPQKTKFAGGVEFYHIADIQQEIVSIEVVFEAGKWHEPQPGVSHFMAHMLEKGTVSKSSSQIATFFEQYGAYINVKSGFDFVSISLYTLVEHLSTLFPVFFELLSAPTFPEVELNKMKDAFIQNLSIKNEKTAYLSSKLIRKKVFGENHPYGKPIEDYMVKTINRNDLHSFFETHMKASYLFALGKIPLKDLTLIKACFDATKPPRRPKKTTIPPPQKNVFQWVEKKDSSQSSIQLGKRAISKTHPDYFNFLILNYYLGGYFGSRLMQNLREEKGLTYGISSAVSAFQHGSILTIATDVNKESRAAAICEIRRELSLLARNGIEEGAVHLVKTHFIGNIHSGVASPFAIMDKIKNRVLQGLPIGFYQDLINHIQACSASSLAASAKRYFDESSFYEVSVG